MSGTPPPWHTIVVGAGPAGLTTSLLLARAGVRVALVDPCARRQRKIGEALPSAGRRFMRHFDLEGPTPEQWCSPIGGVQSLWAADRLQQDFLADPDGPGWRLDRALFEDDLKKRTLEAGATFIQAKVTNLERRSEGWTCQLQGETTPLQGKYLVDATGRSSGLARKEGGERLKGAPLIAVWAVTSAKFQAPPEPCNRTLIETMPEGWWYGAFLPSGEGIAAFHTDKDRAIALKQDPTQWQALLQGTTILSEHFGPAAFDPVALQASDAGFSYLPQPYGDQWLACGDAALALDPLSSQGILNAFLTGKMAADAIMAPDWDKACGDYQERLTRVRRHFETYSQALYARGARHYQTDFWQAACAPVPA